MIKKFSCMLLAAAMLNFSAAAYAGDVSDFASLSSEIADPLSSLETFTSSITLSAPLPDFIYSKTFNGNNYAVNLAGNRFLNDASSSLLNLTISNLFVTNGGAGNGGAMYLENNSAGVPADYRNFTATVFSNNAASADGGAMYLLGGVSIFGQTNSFNGNSAGGSGGAIYAANSSAAGAPSIASFSGNVSFSGNSAGAEGGAVYSSGSTLDFAWTTQASFKNNSAASGGAIAIANNTAAVFGGEILFENNTVSANGGALYISASNVTLNADRGAITFTGNTANGTPNDIYMDINSTLNLNAAANPITMEGGIVTDPLSAGIIINKTGVQTLRLGGINKIWGSFNISAGDIALLSGASLKCANLALPSGSALDMQNGTAETVEAGTFKSFSNLKVDIFDDGTNDKVTSGSAQVGGNLSIQAGVGTYNNSVFNIVESTNTTVSGTFASSSINSAELAYSIDYSIPNLVRLIINGAFLTNFAALSGISYNQRQTAGVLDSISAGSAAPSALMTVINDITALDEQGQRAALSQISGYFLANVIRSAALDSESDKIYDRIKNHCPDGNTSSGVWLQATGGYARYGGDDNSINDYQDVSYGAMGGYDKFLADSKIMLGIYGKYDGHDISQIPGNSADISDTGLGVYGGYIENFWEVKALVAGSYDSYDTTRYIPFNNGTAKGSFSGMTFGGDVEGALKFEAAQNINFRPYAGLEARNSNYGGFTESGAGAFDLKVDGGNYFRSAGRLGAGAAYDDKKWSAYVNTEAKYLFSGTAPEVKSVFDGTSESFYSRGYEESQVIFGAGIGAAVRVWERLKVFANASYYAADKFQNIYGNLGLRYTFCSSNNSAEKESLKQQQAAAAAEAAKVAEVARAETAQKEAELQAAQQQAAQRQAAAQQKAQQKALEEQQAKENAAQQAEAQQAEQERQAQAIIAQEKARQKAEAAAQAAAAKQAKADEQARITAENRQAKLEAKAAKAKAGEQAKLETQQAKLAQQKAQAEEKAKAAAAAKVAEAAKAEAASKKKAQEEADRLAADRLAASRLAAEKLAAEKLAAEKLTAEKLAAEQEQARLLEEARQAQDRQEPTEAVAISTIEPEDEINGSEEPDSQTEGASASKQTSAKKSGIMDNTLLNNYKYKLSGLDELKPKAVVQNSIYIAAPNGIPLSFYKKTVDWATTTAKKILGQ